ncbi:MAG: hypothetical protein ACNI26_14860 [Terasakiella sp.]|uniref:hypothetical protein n=1 Tax=unclassified Terasakiella TaxID=2614952 RepID=UPI003AFF72A3
MSHPYNHHTISLSDTLALRILRACPRAAASMNMAPQECKLLCEFRLELAKTSRTALELSHMNTPCISSHERCILNGLAAVQNNRQDRFLHILEWLVPVWAQESVQQKFQVIAHLLSIHKIHLSLPTLPSPPSSETVELRTING